VRRLLSPRWLAVHLLVLAVAAGFCRLGWWQWQRSQSATGGAQNVIYALEWPGFAIFGLVLWVRTMRDELRGRRAGASSRSVPLVPTEASEPDVAEAAARRAVERRQIEQDELEDPQLAAYNRYLAALNERSQRQARREDAGRRG
jgi:hypothetical protein